MPNTRFDLTHPPFDLLTKAEASALSASADILFFSNDQEILASGSKVDALYLVMKGLVREMSGEEIVGAYREHEAFDCRALAQAKRGTGLWRTKKCCFACSQAERCWL